MNRLQLLTAILLVAISLSPEEVVAKSIDEPVDNQTLVVTEHNMFFNSLNNQEKLAMMKMAIHYFDADQVKFKPLPVANPEIEPKIGSMLPGAETGPEVPETLVSYFLNGKVPKDFQKEFTKWLKRNFNLGDKHLELYRTTEQFCSPGEECPILEDIGGLCCPFG